MNPKKRIAQIDWKTFDFICVDGVPCVVEIKERGRGSTVSAELEEKEARWVLRTLPQIDASRTRLGLLGCHRSSGRRLRCSLRHNEMGFFVELGFDETRHTRKLRIPGGASGKGWVSFCECLKATLPQEKKLNLKVVPEEKKASVKEGKSYLQAAGKPFWPMREAEATSFRGTSDYSFLVSPPSCNEMLSFLENCMVGLAN